MSYEHFFYQRSGSNKLFFTNSEDFSISKSFTTTADRWIRKWRTVGSGLLECAYFSIKREPTSHPITCPHLTWNFLFNSRLHYTSILIFHTHIVSNFIQQCHHSNSCDSFKKSFFKSEFLYGIGCFCCFLFASVFV